jgi:hypothetical protein
MHAFFMTFVLTLTALLVLPLLPLPQTTSRWWRTVFA